MKKTIIIISSVLGVLCLIGIGSYIVINQVNEKIVMVSNIVDEPVSEDIEEESTEIETVTVEQESVVEIESVEESSVVETTEVESTEEESLAVELNESYEEGSYYIKVNEDGTKEYSPYLMTDAMQLEAFKGLSYDEITKVIDTVIDNPKLYGNDEYIRFTVSSLSKRTVDLIVPKESATTNSGSSSNSSNTGTSSSSTGSSTSQQQPVQPEQPQQPVTPTPSTPSQPMEEPQLTQEQLNELYGEGGRLSDFYGESLDLGNNTGETCEDFLEHN